MPLDVLDPLAAAQVLVVRTGQHDADAVHAAARIAAELGYLPLALDQAAASRPRTAPWGGLPTRRPWKSAPGGSARILGEATAVQRFILTGAPGCGKTSILRALAERGYAVVGEAASDVIAAHQADGTSEPWRDPRFTGAIAELQRDRQRLPVRPGARAQVFDRSPVCTLALARWLSHPVSAALSGEIERILRESVYQRQVLFVRPLGFCEPTAARRISYEDSLAFERVHEEEYTSLGVELVHIPPGPVAERAALADRYLRTWSAPNKADCPG